MSMRCEGKASRSLQALRQWIWLAAVTLIVSLGALSAAAAWGDKTLSPDVSEALERFTGGHNYASQAERAKDQALLFANNDAINAARLNNEISNSAYQAAQSDFDQLNTKFGQRAAQSVGADFTVQARSSGTFSPGTDSDYITIVKNKDQISGMQADYNNRVNEFLTKNGAIDAPRNNWQKKLDTDFMADPRYVSESEFEEIGRMNNDAYKRRASADFERISRENGGGKIGPENVTAYTQDMADFTAKKQGDIADMFKNPSNFNDPMNRAKVIQKMAQDQKYISRMEALDDYLRKQEGLPPRNRGVTIAKQGSIRDPGNVNAIKEAHGAASASQASAVDDLVDTLDEIKKTKPNSPFAKSAADDIATIIAQGPAEHRAASIAKLSRADPELAQAVKASPNFSAVDDIVRTGEVKAVTGAGEEAAGLSRAAAEAGEGLEEAATVGRMRKGLTAATETLEKASEVAVRVDAAVAIAKIGEWSATVNKALDPNITDEEAAGLFEKAAGLSQQIAESGLIVPLMEHHPVIASVYLTWTVACVAGEWVVKNQETGEIAGRSKGTCLDRQMSAWDEMMGTYGTRAERDAQNKALCDKFKAAAKEGRVQVKWPYDEDDVCNSLKRGEKVGDMLENPTGPKSTAQLCANAEVKVNAATRLTGNGELGAAQNLLTEARSKLDDAGPKACPGLDGRVAAQQSKIDSQAAAHTAKADGALSNCKFVDAYPTIQNLPDGPEKTSLLARWNQGLETSHTAHDMISRAKTMEDQGNYDGAVHELQEAKGLNPCQAVVAEIDKAIADAQTKIAQAKDCAPLNAQVDIARADYAKKGGLSDTKKELDSVKQKLDKMDANACPDVRERVAKGDDKVKKMTDALSKIKTDLTTCDPATLKRRAEQLSKLNHVWLKSLGERARLSVAVAENYQKANAAYLAGDMRTAREFYNEALREAKNAGRPTCIDIADRIDKNIAKVDTVEKEENWINNVASDCDISRISTERNRIASTAKTSFQFRMMDTLDAAMGTCKAKEPEASEAQCEQHNDAGCAALYQWWQANQCTALTDKGAMYLPADKVPLHDECFSRLTEVNRCMASGNWLSPDEAQAKAQACAEKAKTAEEQQTQQASDQQGACSEGYTAGPVLDNGEFFCVPSQETADTWCAAHNPPGYTAVHINSKGAFDCWITKAAATTWCHDTYGHGAHLGSRRRDGTFWCYGQRQVQKRTTSHRQPRNVTRGPSGADIGAAIGTAIIQGIIASQHGGHGSSGE